MFDKFKVGIGQKMRNIIMRTTNKIINTNYFIFFDQIIAQMRTDKTSATGDNNIFLHDFFFHIFFFKINQ